MSVGTGLAPTGKPKASSYEGRLWFETNPGRPLEVVNHTDRGARVPGFVR
jgi:hypothetical protein